MRRGGHHHLTVVGDEKLVSDGKLIVNGKPLCIGEAVKNSDAVIEMFNGGDLGGLCAAELIDGQWNPSGKLPISFPRSSAQIPCYYNTYPGWHGGKYMDVEKGSLYDFGYGLSYTDFELTCISCKKSEDKITLTVKVTNKGDIDGDEIVQVYVGSDNTGADRPVKVLKGFKRVSVKAGEALTAEIDVLIDDISFYNPENSNWELDESYTVYVGADSKNLEVAGKITF